MKKMIIFLTLPVLLLTGCASMSSESPQELPESTPSTTVEVDTLHVGFDSIVSYPDGVSITVSAPVEFTPSPQAAGFISGQTAVLFTVVITNNSDAPVNLQGYPDVTSNGEPAKSITDFGANIGDTPASDLAVGESMTWLEGYNVVNIEDVTFIHNPNGVYEPAIFDSKLKLA